MNSYPLLNEIYFNIVPFKTVHEIELLKPFFYKSVSVVNDKIVTQHTQKTFDSPLEEVLQSKLLPIVSCTNNTNKPIVNMVSEPTRETSKQKWFDPCQKDTIFWCIYTAVFGLSEYMLIGRKYANREWEEKNAAIIAFKKCSKELRTTNHRITLGNIEEMMSEYMTNQSNITLLGLVGLSVYYKIQIYLIDSVKKTHLVYTPENYSNTCYIYKHPKIKDKYRLSLIENDVTDSFCLVSFTRPLRSISSYKLSELEKIAKRFGINELQKKSELYKEITEHIVWL